MILVSVVVTVYNVEKYIARCIDSILNQSYQEFELIIVNDGTPDNSMLIAEQYRHKDERVRIVDYGNNVGLMCARRRGYLEAKGDYVFFVDSDDTIPDDALEKLVKEANISDADLIAGNGKYFMADGTMKEIHLSLPYGNDSLALYKALIHYFYPHYIWGKLIRKELLHNFEYKYFDRLTNAEDYCLIYQLAENIKKTTCIHDVVYYYYQNKESSSQVKLSYWQLECNVMVYSYIFKKISKNPLLCKDIYASTQRTMARFYAKGYNQEGYFDSLMEKYSIKGLLSISAIMRYNTPLNALICILGKSKIGTILYKYTHF